MTLLPGDKEPDAAIAAKIAALEAERDCYRAALEKITSGNVEQRGSHRPSFADASKVAREALAGDAE